MLVLSNLRAPLICLTLLATPAACGGGQPSDEHKAQAICNPVVPTECPEPAPHYSDIAPIIAGRCASCHTGDANAQWPLDQYDHVADWASFIHDELLRCSMPPADSGVDMTPDEREQILVWLRCGYPK